MPWTSSPCAETPEIMHSNDCPTIFSRAGASTVRLRRQQTIRRHPNRDGANRDGRICAKCKAKTQNAQQTCNIYMGLSWFELDLFAFCTLALQFAAFALHFAQILPPLFAPPWLGCSRLECVFASPWPAARCTSMQTGHMLTTVAREARPTTRYRLSVDAQTTSQTSGQKRKLLEQQLLGQTSGSGKGGAG